MILIPRRRIWTQQPQQAAGIDWSNPLVIAAKIKYVVVTGGCGLRTTTIFQKSKALILPTRCGLVTPIGVSSLYTGGDASSLTGTAGFANNSRSMFALIHGGITASSYDYCRMTQASGGQIEYNHGNITFSVRTYSGTFTTPAVGKTGQLRVWGTWDQPNNVGTLYVPGNTPVTVGTTSTWDINNDLVGVFNGADQASLLLGFYCEGVVQKGVMDALSSNPWQIFRAPDSRIWIPSSGGAPAGAVLAGNAQGQATATGNLTLQASLDAVALAVATASGNLTTFIPLAGAAVAIGAANGSLTTGIKLSAAATASALASGSLVAQIKLNGAALAQAAASAGLTSAILLAGIAQGHATASGTLAADPGSMAGNAQAQAVAVATLTTSIKLSGTAAAQAGVSGILTTNISLTAAALAQAIATGTLAVPILLAGAAHGVATASGNLTAPDSPATAVHFRLSSSVRRLTKAVCMVQRLTQAKASAQRLTTINHEVQHA